MRLLANASWPRLWLSTYTLYIYICYIIHSVHSKHCEAGTLETTIINSAVGAAGSPLGPFETLWSCNINRRVAALRARTAAIYRTKEVPHTLPIFSRSRVIVDHHMSICQTGRPVACMQCVRALNRTAVLACAHGASVHGLLSWGPVS